MEIEWLLTELGPISGGVSDYYWDVAQGKLNSPDPKDKSPNADKLRQNYINGNRAARFILMNSIHSDLAAKLFMDDSETIDGAKIWRSIKRRFQHADGTKKGLALTKFNTFRWQNGISAEENSKRSKRSRSKRS